MLRSEVTQETTEGSRTEAWETLHGRVPRCWALLSASLANLRLVVVALSYSWTHGEVKGSTHTHTHAHVHDSAVAERSSCRDFKRFRTVRDEEEKGRGRGWGRGWGRGRVPPASAACLGWVGWGGGGAAGGVGVSARHNSVFLPSPDKQLCPCTSPLNKKALVGETKMAHMGGWGWVGVGRVTRNWVEETKIT